MAAKKKTHCRHGHEYTEENTIRRHDRGLDCRQCARATHIKWRGKNLEKVRQNNREWWGLNKRVLIEKGNRRQKQQNKGYLLKKNRYLRWTEEEEKLALKAGGNEHAMIELSQQMERSYSAISNKYFLLKDK